MNEVMRTLRIRFDEILDKERIKAEKELLEKLKNMEKPKPCNKKGNKRTRTIKLRHRYSSKF